MELFEKDGNKKLVKIKKIDHSQSTFNFKHISHLVLVFLLLTSNM